MNKSDPGTGCPAQGKKIGYPESQPNTQRHDFVMCTKVNIICGIAVSLPQKKFFVLGLWDGGRWTVDELDLSILKILIPWENLKSSGFGMIRWN